MADMLGKVGGGGEDAPEIAQVRKHLVGQLCWPVYRVASSRLDSQASRD